MKHLITKYKIVLVFVLTILLVWIIRIYLPSKKSNADITNEFWIRKTHVFSKKNIVAAGNSRVYRGISIKALQNGIAQNINGVNLGYSALGYSYDYLEYVESRVDKSSKCKILLFGVEPGNFTKIAAENKSFKQYKDVRETEVFKTLYINPYFNLPTFSPTEIIDLLVSPKSNNGFIEIRKNYFGKYYEDGWVASYKIPGNPDEALPIYKKFWSKNDSNLDIELIEQFFQKLYELSMQGITIVGFRPPSTEGMQKWENEQFKFNEDYFKSRFEKIGGIWIDVNTSQYNSYDGAHLHYESAEKLSFYLGEKIKAFCYPE